MNYASCGRRRYMRLGVSKLVIGSYLPLRIHDASPFEQKTVNICTTHDDPISIAQPEPGSPAGNQGRTCLHILRAPIFARPIGACSSNFFGELIVVAGALLVDAAVEKCQQIVEVGIIDADRNL